MDKKVLAATLLLTVFLAGALLAQAKPDREEGEATITLEIKPSYKELKAGEVARFTVKVESLDHSRIVVELGVEGLPDGAVGILTPTKGKTPFRSMLTVITSLETQPGQYVITVVAVSGEAEASGQLALIVNPPGVTVTTTTTETTTTRENSLVVSVQTERPVYYQNEVVKISGSVRDSSQNAVPEAEVSIQVENPLGTVVHSALTRTNGLGVYFDNFTVGEVGYSVFLPGTYTIFVTASKLGYIDGHSHASFVIEETSLPSVNFVTLYTTDPNGNLTSDFSPGETLIVWLSVENFGANLTGAYIWMEIDDPEGIPLFVHYDIDDLRTGETATKGSSFTVPTAAAKGTYVVRAFVSDKLISQGGKFLAIGELRFMVV